MRAHHDEIVDAPRLEPFEMPGADAAMRSAYATEADLETHALAPGYTYAFRMRGMDVLVRVTLANVDLVRDALPVLDEFVRGITVQFDADAA